LSELIKELQDVFDELGECCIDMDRYRGNTFIELKCENFGIYLNFSSIEDMKE